MCVQFCVALLALCSLAAASDPGCGELIKPLENRTQVTGKWIFHGSISDTKEGEEKVKAISSSWLEILDVSDSNDIVLRWADRMNDKCFYGNINYTFSPNISRGSFEFNSTTIEYAGRYLDSGCSGCLLWFDTVTQTKNWSSLYIYKKTTSLENSQLERFKKQASCLGLTSEVHLLETTNLCPDASDAKEKEKD